MLSPTVVSKWKSPLIFVSIFCALLFFSQSRFNSYHPLPPPLEVPHDRNTAVQFRWSDVPHHFPITSMANIPTGTSQPLPKIQQTFPKETRQAKRVRLERLEKVKGNFTHAWKGYKEHAWLRDELMPISGKFQDPFGGWAATLVDSLDTLWIMGLYDEFQVAVAAIEKIDFSTCALQKLNVFETTIRYLGGFLSAYDLSGGKYPVLIQKAMEMGDMLYKAFDTPNRMPILRWDWRAAINGTRQEADENVLVSEIGSLSLEFTRLSQITGDTKYFDAIQRVMDVFDEQQDKTKLPGMWSVVVNAKDLDFSSYHAFTIGGMADSLYEYLPKQHILLGGSTQQFRRMYEYTLVALKRNIFYRPMTKTNSNIRIAGNVDSDGKTLVQDLKTDSQAQHLGCFAGGMVAIGSKIFQNPEDLVLAKRLVEGCLWAYEVMPNGIMPEIMHTVPCEDKNNCPWDEEKWRKAVEKVIEGDADADTKILINRLQPGVAKVDDSRYILRPEAIESVFILYRITGDPLLMDRAWNMFNNIIKYTLTDIAHAALDDCTVLDPPKSDRMESFWLAETLKYFYLIFSEPDLIDLDEYVLNTEAHPLKRPGYRRLKARS